MTVKLDRKVPNMKTTARAVWAFSQISTAIGLMLLLAALAWTPRLASAEGIQLESLDDPRHEKLKAALESAGYTDVHYVAIATGEKMDSFYGGEPGAFLNEAEAFEPGEFVVSLPPPFGFDFAKEDAGFRAICISSHSPGSENDCRRGGSCRSAQR
jgi:hypothetical protein